MQAQFQKNSYFLQGKRVQCFQRYRTNACTKCGILRPKTQRKTRCPCIWIQRLQNTNAYTVERFISRRFIAEWRYFSELIDLSEINLSFHYETGEILEQSSTLWACSISVPGDIQNFTECGCKQPDKTWPFFEEIVGPEGLSKYFPTDVILWILFYELCFSCMCFWNILRISPIWCLKIQLSLSWQETCLCIFVQFNFFFFSVRLIAIHLP